jgi:hypothetical protein
MAYEFDHTIYRKQQPAENIFWVRKRKFSADRNAGSFTVLMKEITSKTIVCNLSRFLLSLVIGFFPRANNAGVQKKPSRRHTTTRNDTHNNIKPPISLDIR